MYLHFALTTIVFVGYYVSGNSVEGWIATPSVSRQSRASIVSVGHQQSFGYIDTSLGAGFGASASAGSAKNNNDGNKLKPKQQWDRYMNDLKKMDKIRVGVRVEGGEGENNDWIEAGHIKSLDNLYTEVAVVRQRALIADVSKIVLMISFSRKIG